MVRPKGFEWSGQTDPSPILTVAGITNQSPHSAAETISISESVHGAQVPEDPNDLQATLLQRGKGRSSLMKGWLCSGSASCVPEGQEAMHVYRGHVTSLGETTTHRAPKAQTVQSRNPCSLGRVGSGQQGNWGAQPHQGGSGCLGQG